MDGARVLKITESLLLANQVSLELLEVCSLGWLARYLYRAEMKKLLPEKNILHVVNASFDLIYCPS
jgi:hypothetical protein